MKFFRNFLMILAPLALCTGCPSDPIDGSQDTSTQVDGGGNDGGGDATSDTPTGGWEDIKLHPTEGYVAVEISTPDGKPADFYICLGGCGDDKTLPTPDESTILEKNIVKLQHFTKAPIEGKGIEMAIRIARPNYLFVDWKFFVNGHPDKSWTKSYTHEWKNAGSWGLAPNGTYKSSHSGKNESVSTSVKDGKVTLKWVGGDAIITHDEISPDDQIPEEKISGKISDDLSQIQVQVDRPFAPENNYQATLTIVK